MENVVDFVNQFVSKSKISSRDDIARRIEEIHKKEDKKIIPPKNYFYVTDVCIPADFFAENILGKKQTPELKKILNQGHKIHNIVQNWLKQHDNYFGSESILDGNFKGIPVRGKTDGRIGELIIEVKSIGYLPENPKDIIEKYPQYLEQVAFYSEIDALAPKNNYLVFVTRKPPYKIKSFKLFIKNPDKIRNILKKRIHLMKEISEGKGNPNILGKCRYCYEEDCNVKKDGKCFLFKLKPLGCEMGEYIELVESLEFTKEIEELKKEYGENFRFYTAFNILHPRKFCFKEISDKEEEPFDDKYLLVKSYFNNLIYKFIKDNGLLHKNKEESIFSEFGLDKYSWFIDKTSINPGGNIIPFITHASDYYNFDRPHEYKIAELGIYLMVHRKSKGLIFHYYPKKDKIKVFEINFDFKGDYINELKKIIKGLNNPRNFKSLPKCSFGCETCVYSDECNTKIE